MATEKLSLKDHLFNSESIGQLADEFAVLPGFPRDAFHGKVCGGLEGRELLQRLEWMADCLEPHLSSDFPTLAAQLEAAMPPALDPNLSDDDFGHFIHALPGILAVRHGLETHRERALDLLHAATKRFSMEFYIRPFLNCWPDHTMTRLEQWARDENYHVRRLVSEGTRPTLPWAKRITLDPLAPLPLLRVLHADPTRYVTRSVANHLNDISKTAPDLVLETLEGFRVAKTQSAKELAWMERHALRTLIKSGHAPTMEFLGYRADAPVKLEALTVTPRAPRIGEVMEIEIVLSAPSDEPVIVDCAMHLLKSNGSTAPKVFKIKDTVISKGRPLTLTKRHRFRGGASTFTLYPGPQEVAVHVNGRELGRAAFDLKSA